MKDFMSNVWAWMTEHLGDYGPMILAFALLALVFMNSPTVVRNSLLIVLGAWFVYSFWVAFDDQLIHLWESWIADGERVEPSVRGIEEEVTHVQSTKKSGPGHKG